MSVQNKKNQHVQWKRRSENQDYFTQEEFDKFTNYQKVTAYNNYKHLLKYVTYPEHTIDYYNYNNQNVMVYITYPKHEAMKGPIPNPINIYRQKHIDWVGRKNKKELVTSDEYMNLTTNQKNRLLNKYPELISYELKEYLTIS